MCFYVTKQFGEKMVAVEAIPIRKVIDVLITRSHDGVQVLFQSPYYQQHYRIMHVSRKEVYHRVSDIYSLNCKLPRVTMSEPKKYTTAINEGYHSYVMLRSTPASHPRLFEDDQNTIGLAVRIPVDGYIPVGVAFYYDQQSAEYVSEQINLYMYPNSSLLATALNHHTLYAVDVGEYLALLAHMVMYNRSTKWYDKELQKIRHSYTIF